MSLERRPYFVLGDLLACLVSGALIGGIVSLGIGESWNMWIAMLVGMLVGMLLALPASFAFMPFFGAMEVMLPVMLTGMLAGMWLGMAAAMRPVGFGDAALTGAGIGLGVVVVTYLVNAGMQARAS